MSTWKITVKKSEISPLSDMRESCCRCFVLCNKWTHHHHKSLVLYLCMFVYVYIVGCCYNTQASMQCFLFVYTTLCDDGHCERVKIYSRTSMPSLNQDKWLGTAATNCVPKHTHFPTTFLHHLLLFQDKIQPLLILILNWRHRSHIVNDNFWTIEQYPSSLQHYSSIWCS